MIGAGYDRQKNDLSQRIYNFALRIVNLVRSLPKEMAAYEIGKQLIRAGTSVAANYDEATVAFSKEDFTYKLSIAFKEAKETNLWLRLLKDSGIVNSVVVDGIIRESDEIKKILGKSVKTSKGQVSSNK